jgi:hypothetical protein
VTAIAVALTPDQAKLAVLPQLNGGGVVGVSISDLMQQYFSNSGAILLVVVTIVVGVLLAADEIVMRGLQAIRRAHWPVPVDLKKHGRGLRELRDRVGNLRPPGWWQGLRERFARQPSVEQPPSLKARWIRPTRIRTNPRRKRPNRPSASPHLLTARPRPPGPPI